MKNRENSTERRSGTLILYFSIMVFLLGISYVLIITNPPSDLLRYDNNLRKVVTKDNLSVSEIPEHMGSISIFLGLYAFLTFFIGLSMSIIYEVEGESSRCAIILIISLFLPLMLGSLLYPYYGSKLVSTVIPIGYLTELFGLSFHKRLRAQFIPSILMASVIVVTWFAFLYETISGLTALVVVMVLMSIAIITAELKIFAPLTLKILSALKKWRKRRRKRGKKSHGNRKSETQ